MPTDIDLMSARTGRTLKEDGSYANLADLIEGSSYPKIILYDAFDLAASGNMSLPSFDTLGYSEFAFYVRSASNGALLAQLRFLDPPGFTLPSKPGRYLGVGATQGTAMLERQPIYGTPSMRLLIVNTGSESDTFQAVVYLWR